jgi:hypothetical protein
MATLRISKFGAALHCARALKRPILKRHPQNSSVSAAALASNIVGCGDEQMGGAETIFAQYVPPGAERVKR